MKISEGCNHPCAFCIIPAVRGRHRSRPMESIVDEVKRLADEGVREVVLVAQDTTWYGRDLYGEYNWPSSCGGWQRSRGSTGCGCSTRIRPT